MVSGSKSSSRIKKNKKQGMVFAKDPKQVVMLVVIFVLLLVATVHAMIQMSPSQDPIAAPAQTPVAPTDADPTKSTQGVDAMSGSQDPSVMQGQVPPATQGSSESQDANDIYSQTVNLQKNQANNANSSVLPSQAPSGNVEILPQKRGKMVSIVVGNSGRSNPFLPQSENNNVIPGKLKKPVYPFLTAPPETLHQDSDAGKIMTTVVSGILYDKYSPSAILNIEGTDYLFKKGDVVNHYKVLSISPTQVVVQLGRNVYQAGVGQLLSPADLGINAIANLNKKFGGNNSFSIRVKVKKSNKRLKTRSNK